MAPPQFQSRLAGFLFFYGLLIACSSTDETRFNPVWRDFCFSTCILSNTDQMLVPLFQSRLAGFLFFYSELIAWAKHNTLFQSRLAGFLFFYDPQYRLALLQFAFQSRLAGFLFFYNVKAH